MNFSKKFMRWIAKISKNQRVEFVDLRFANRMYVKPVSEVLK